MNNRRYGEHTQHANHFRSSLSSQREVHMSQEEMMGWQVPGSPVLSHSIGVPPILVEEPVSKASDLSHEIHPDVETHVEEHEPGECIGDRESQELFR